MGQIAPRAFGLAILAVVLGVVASVVWVLVYALAVAPGQGQQAYVDYANAAAPTIALTTGVPIMVLLGWWIGRGRDRRTALFGGALVALFFFAIDIALLAGLGNIALAPWAEILPGYGARLAAALAGAALAARGGARTAG